jgi:hypothetical protein
MEKRNDALFELATYLIASARDCLEEPLIYGPLRMIVGVEKIIEMGKLDPSFRDEFLEAKRGTIAKETLAVMSDRKAFSKTLDEILLAFSDEMRKRTIKS